MSPFFIPFKKWVQYRPMAPFTHNVKKIKGAVHKKGDIDATCKQAFRPIARLPIDVGNGVGVGDPK